MSRKAARDSAFKLIYQVPFHGDNDVTLTMDNFKETDDYGKLTQDDYDYVDLCVARCFDNLEDIDKSIRESLVNWSIDRISRVNLAILRLSLSEMRYADVPLQVSINEAVELAKKYSDDDSPAFVNGVLAKILKES